MVMIDTWVCVDDEHIYPARVDLSNRWNGWLSPGFTLDTVRELAAHTEEMAEECGHECVDQIKVIDGEPEPVVLHIRWQWVTSDDPGTAVNVVKPDTDGLYWIGGWEWTWYQVEDGPLFYTQNEAFAAWRCVLSVSARRIGEIIRTQMPGAVSCLADLTDLERIVQVNAPTEGVTWPSGTRADGEDGYGPFDTETLGEADEVLRKALDHGRDTLRLELGGWRVAREIGQPDLHCIVFDPTAVEAAGDGPLDKARAKATDALRKLLTETVPYLAADARAVFPEACGVVIDPAADRPFVTCIVDSEGPTESTPVATEIAEKLHERLEQMLAYRPTREDLIACGWTDVPAELDGTYAITFPAE